MTDNRVTFMINSLLSSKVSNVRLCDNLFLIGELKVIRIQLFASVQFFCHSSRVHIDDKVDIFFLGRHTHTYIYIYCLPCVHSFSPLFGPYVHSFPSIIHSHMHMS